MKRRRPIDNEFVAFRQIFGRSAAQPLELLSNSGAPISKDLQVNIVFTDEEGTRAALARAVDLIIDLEAETRIIVPHVVPYPLPLEEPTVPLDFACRQVRCLAGSVGADPYVDIYLCRDRLDLLLRLLPADSIVVIGSRRRWFPTKAERMGRVLRKNGCDVLIARYE